MKALTICQPYAHLIAIGKKRVEHRTWSTRYRGPLVIHAGKSTAWLEGAVDYARYPDMSFGAIVAVATLVGCLEDDGEVDWILEDVRRLERPVPWRGERGLWDIPDDWETVGVPAPDEVASGHGTET